MVVMLFVSTRHHLLPNLSAYLRQYLTTSLVMIDLYPYLFFVMFLHKSTKFLILLKHPIDIVTMKLGKECRTTTS